MHTSQKKGMFEQRSLSIHSTACTRLPKPEQACLAHAATCSTCVGRAHTCHTHIHTCMRTLVESGADAAACRMPCMLQVAFACCTLRMPHAACTAQYSTTLAASSARHKRWRWCVMLRMLQCFAVGCSVRGLAHDSRQKLRHVPLGHLAIATHAPQSRRYGDCAGSFASASAPRG